MDRADLLQQMTTSHGELQTLISSLTEGQLTQAGVYGELSIKDVLAHIAAWQQMECGWLSASLRGENVVRFTPEYLLTGHDHSDEAHTALMDRLNQHIFITNRDKPAATVIADLQSSHDNLVAIVQSLDPDDLNDPHRFTWWDGEPIWTSIAGNSYEHYQEHQDLITQWLQRQPTS